MTEITILTMAQKQEEVDEWRDVVGLDLRRRCLEKHVPTKIFGHERPVPVISCRMVGWHS